MRYLDSPRHACYVNSRAYQAYLAQLRDRFGWPYPADLTYAPARKTPAPRVSAAGDDLAEKPA